MKTKLLKNIGIYYLILTLISVGLSFCVGLYLFIPLLPAFALGIIFIICYMIFKKKKITTRLTKKQLEYLNFFFIIFPFLYIMLTIGFRNRPYKQAVVLPKNYEGILAIQYNKPNGQEEEWTGGFLGIGASRLIKVDSTGIAKTQFKYHYNSIPFLGLKQDYDSEGLKIYYEGDLWNEIKRASFFEWENNIDKEYIYFTSFNKYPLIIFVVTKPKNYHNYFMTEEEMINDYKTKQNQEPSSGSFFNVRILHNKYTQYYKLQEHYLNK